MLFQGKNNRKAYITNPAKKVPSQDHRGVVRIASDKFEFDSILWTPGTLANPNEKQIFSAAPAAGDKLVLCMIPANAKVLDVICHTPASNLSPIGGAIDIGWELSNLTPDQLPQVGSGSAVIGTMLPPVTSQIGFEVEDYDGFKAGVSLGAPITCHMDTGAVVTAAGYHKVFKADVFLCVTFVSAPTAVDGSVLEFTVKYVQD